MHQWSGWWRILLIRNINYCWSWGVMIRIYCWRRRGLLRAIYYSVAKEWSLKMSNSWQHESHMMRQIGYVLIVRLRLPNWKPGKGSYSPVAWILRQLMWHWIYRQISFYCATLVSTCTLNIVTPLRRWSMERRWISAWTTSFCNPYPWTTMHNVWCCVYRYYKNYSMIIQKYPHLR